MRIDFPPEFDPAYYSRVKPYLPHNRTLLQQEFELYGKKSGTPGSFFCYRENVLKVFGKLCGQILEIGPGHAPDFTGDNVKYLDIVREEELSSLYPGLPEKNGGAPHIDYLLSDLVDGQISERFDLVYSAHNFEHQANCVMHLNSIADILNPGGYFLAAIPDKNYTFDYYRQTSTLIDVLSAENPQTMHSMRTLITPTMTTHNDTAQHWFGYHGESKLSNEAAVNAYINADRNTFQSKHVWAFDADAFRTIFRILSEKGIVKLKLLRTYNTPFLRNEFMTIFQKPE